MLIHADCLEALRNLPDNSVDSVVTDPPYGLSFMGKKWDYDVPSVDIWQECLRVLKPGGYLLSFAGTRTQHRIACGIEDAGFEIRDMIAWVYGSGFPKSLNVGKAVDKMQGNEREQIGEQRLTGNAGTPTSLKGGTYTSGVCINMTGVKIPITKGNSPYEGYGTALKPALEPITVARKPIEGTVAANVLKWGTGAINIDGCRVEGNPVSVPMPTGGTGNIYGFKNGVGRNGEMSDNSRGRFPANFIHDGSDEVLELFPECKQANDVSEFKQLESMRFSAGGQGVKPQKQTNGKIITASAARFFYCAKASKAERNMGCEGMMPVRDADRAKDDGAGGNNPRNRSNNPKQNHHPTVKPLALMRYLVRLVTPPNGTVLDPFLGSGTTAIAAIQEGFDWIGIEREAEYCDIAEARIAAAEPQQIEVAL